MKYIIDRFETKNAVCEDEMKKMVLIPKYRLPLEAKEGDCLVEEDGFIKLDHEMTREKKNSVKDRMSRLFES